VSEFLHQVPAFFVMLIPLPIGVALMVLYDRSRDREERERAEADYQAEHEPHEAQDASQGRDEWFR
jgi:hypothetical protein